MTGELTCWGPQCVWGNRNSTNNTFCLHSYCQWATEQDALYYNFPESELIVSTTNFSPCLAPSKLRPAIDLVLCSRTPQQCESLPVRQKWLRSSGWGMVCPNTALLSPSDTLDNSNNLVVPFSSLLRTCWTVRGKKRLNTKLNEYLMTDEQTDTCRTPISKTITLIYHACKLHTNSFVFKVTDC